METKAEKKNNNNKEKEKNKRKKKKEKEKEPLPPSSEKALRIAVCTFVHFNETVNK